MRIFNGVKWVCLLAAFSGLANADLILDNSRVITDVIGITISPNTGDIILTTASQNYTVTQGSTTPPPPSGSVAINSFTATPNPIDEGQSTSISWTTSNATSCTATGGDDGWQGSAIALPNGSRTVTITTAGSYTFRLTCSGTNGPVFRDVIVTVNSPGSTPPPVPTTCQSSPLTGAISTWSSVWSINFPGPTYDTENVVIPRTGYRAIQFNTGNVVDHAGIISIANTFTNGVRLGAISECAGDFNVVDECTHTWGSSGGIGWATDGESGYCPLKANTTYYMNFTFTDGFNPNTSGCGLNESCIATLQHINLD